MLAIASVFVIAASGIFLVSCGESSTFKILLLDEDGYTVLYSQNLEENDPINAPTPTKASDAQYTYTFSGWVDEDGNRLVLSFATKNITAYASYSASVREYSLNIVANDSVTYSYDKVSVTLDGVELTSGASVCYGDLLEISINGSSGYTVDEDSKSFEGLQRVTQDGKVMYKVVGDVTISFSESANTYTVKLYDYNKTRTLQTLTASYGESVLSLVDTPTREQTLRGSYLFDCWLNMEDDSVVDLSKITSNISAYASYSETLTPYTLTILNTSYVTVKNGDEEILDQGTIYYGDTLTIVTNTTTGYQISSLTATSELDGTTGDAVDVSTSKSFTVVGNMTISYAQEIITYTVRLYIDDTYTDYTIPYGTNMTTSSQYFTPYTPTKVKDNTYTYSFVGWVDKDGQDVDLSCITSSVTAYAEFEKTYIEYELSMTKRVSVTVTSGEYEGSVFTYQSTNPTLHYGDQFVIVCDLADGFSTNTLTVNGTTITEGETQTATGETEIVFAMEKTFVAEAYANLKKFTSFSGSDGKTISTSNSDCVLDSGFYFFTYVGLDEVEYTANYSTFLAMSPVNWTADDDIRSSDSHTTKFDSASNKWTTSSNSTWYTDYITEALYMGMFIEFTIYNPNSNMIIGLSTETSINNPKSNLIANTSGLGIYVPTYNFYSQTSNSYLQLAYENHTSDAMKDKTNLYDDEGNGLPVFYSSSGSSYNYGSDGVVTIKLVLSTSGYIVATFSNSSGEVLHTATLTDWTISSGTAYYFSILSYGSGVTAVINDFGYVNTFESMYVSSLSGKTITLVGDSITYGVGSSDNSLRYSTVLAASLGMTENNMGESGTQYCEGYTYNEEDASRINDVSSISLNSEILIVYLGINDYNRATSEQFLIGEEDSTDTSTICGALNTMYAAIAERFKDSSTQIYICTTATTYAELSGTSNSSATYTLQELNNTIIGKAESYGFGTINLYTGIDWEVDVDYLSTDSSGLHPSDAGHAKIANYIYNQIVSDNSVEYVLNWYASKTAAAS